ncbi:MAG TPA: pyridoxamine 5'-phosphate oxidase [Gemmatimonadales bacterium]|jgi:pyridoxamine 5'-phosphate oxidase
MSLIARLRTIVTFGQGVVRGLPDARPDEDPLDLFRLWYAAAERAGIYLPEAMALGTATPDGLPAVRIVLLKGLDERGFTFFTSYESRKGLELRDNPRAALTFHWAALERQVRIEGTVTRLSEDESVAYFRSRPRGSRIGAWASRQSEVLETREELERRVREYGARFRDGDVPLPPFWGGYRVAPARIEFWQGRVNRLHDRLLFERTGTGWKSGRLYP